MSGKPAQICTLQKNKFVGGQQGFVDTFNWVASCADNIKGGKGCQVKHVDKGTPEVEVQIQPGDGIDVICAGPGEPYTISLVQPEAPAGMTNLSVYGTDGTCAIPLSGEYQISAMSDTNLSVTCPLNDEDKPGNVIAIGVYWI